ncbi:hypothetical protein HH310_30590 [Actinoplanes sp. TBRC 11911]|uniref:DUF6510 family protein n=1 Tax=Actinoplanes sp. TBRC 11911 TaxID=2729386 RepID=UPI00145EBA1E|nr:DUF6510 family protein [Actinoplanes sp. TBRC 11911]NMO55520.1 hypothetical protein [Actinoplanes sp. TBRC 11911]
MTGWDGNAVAGLLYDLFGQEMTGVGATCAHCGRRSLLARTRVFRGPGTVLLCPACGGSMLVVCVRDGIACVDAPGFATLAVPLREPVSLRPVGDQSRPRTA